jgi:hypothetical protein
MDMRSLRVVNLALLLGPAPGSAAASPAEARLREALRSTTAQLRALED